MNRQYIVGFDILKFIMSIVIVSLHSEAFTSCDALHNFQSLAVPIFFVLSSFLFFDKLGKSDNQLRTFWDFEYRILLLYLIWSIIMIPITIRYHQYCTSGILGFFLWLKDFFFDYTFLASWFFGALLVGMPIVFILRHKQWLLLLVSLVLYILFTFYDQIPSFAKIPFEWYHNNLGTPERSFLMGILWLGIGCVLAQTQILHGAYDKIRSKYHLDNVMDCASVSRFFVWMVILVLIMVLCSVFRVCQIIGVVAVVLLFYIVADSNRCSPHFINLCVMLRKCSIIIYCVHYVILHILWNLIPQNKILVFAFAVFLSVMVAFIIVKASDKIKVLKYLY